LLKIIKKLKKIVNSLKVNFEALKSEISENYIEEFQVKGSIIAIVSSQHHLK